LKIVYSDKKSGRSMQAEISKDLVPQLINMRIGEMLDGSIIGLPGYKLKITGGSDTSGFGMNKNTLGSRKIKVLRELKHGQLERLTVVGNSISATTAQINAVVTEYGSKPAEEVFPTPKPKEKKAPEAKADEKGKGKAKGKK
jgi:small subunit ribosomal protein S6e